MVRLPHSAYRRQNGFTIVELVVVVLLLGVLSAVAFPRFVRADAFAASVLSAGLRETVALASQLAASRQDADIQLELAKVDDQWQGRLLSSVEGELRLVRYGDGSPALLLRNGVVPHTVDETAAALLAFDGRGRLTNASVGANALDVQQGLQFEVGAAGSFLFCVYPTGSLQEAPCG